jgi:hypothetical protein
MEKHDMNRKRRIKSVTKRKKRGLAYQDFVALVIKAMDPNADAQSEQWVDGPDGRRDMDVLITGKIDQKNYRILIECKDYDPQKTGPVDIGVVDGLDSKRRDLDVNGAMICSNSGFTEGAIRKAKRVNIGLVSILKANDPQVKVVIQEEIYTRKVKVGTFTMKFDSNQPLEPLIAQVPSTGVTYKGFPIVN